MAETALWMGAWASARAAQVEEKLAAASGRGLLITPSQGQARVRRERLALRCGGAWGPTVLPLTEFAAWILRDGGIAFRRLADFERYLFLQQCLHTLEAEGDLPRLTVPYDTPGLLRHLLRVLTQLKQCAIEPEEFAQHISAEADFDRLVSAAYHRYQAHLKDLQAYDVPGIYWEAAAQVARKKPAFLKNYTLLCFDGFDDFTPSEFRLLEGLAHAGPRLLFGINHDPTPSRQDLFLLPRQTCEQIQHRFSVQSQEVFETASPHTQAAYAEAHLFWRDPPPHPEGLENNLRIKPCTDLAHEVESLARCIRQDLQDGVPAQRIALVFTDPEAVVNAVRATCAAYGIPLRLQYRPRLSESAIGVFLLRLMEALRDWERDTVLDVLIAPWFPKSKTATHFAPYFPALARAAQVIRGRVEWRGRFQYLLKRIQRGTGQDIEALLRRVPDAEAALKAFAKTLARLGELTEHLLVKDSLAGHARRLDDVVEQLGLETALDDHPDTTLVAEEQRALAALRNLLGMMAAYEQEDALLPSEAFFPLLTQGMADTRYTLPQPNAGIWCGDASAIRGLDFDRVYFGGLNEGLLPKATPGNGIYSEQDMERLRRSGIALEDAVEQRARQQLLFHHVLVAAQGHLTLSWRMMKEGGREASYSPFLAHVQELFPNPKGIMDAPPLSDSFLASLENTASLRELRNRIFYAHPEWEQASQTYFPEACWGARIESRRQSAAPYDRHDGAIESADLLTALQEDYGDAHHFSVNQLETQADCPFRFFLERALKIDETEIPEAAFDPRIRGSMLHEVLCRFHREFRGIPTQEIPPESAETHMASLVETIFEEFAHRSITAPPGVKEVEKAQMLERLQRYLLLEREYADKPWAPQHFEVTFGRAHHEDSPKDPLSQEAPLALETPEGMVLFAGIIDRIDILDDFLRLIDYKSGQLPRAMGITKGRSMQLTLYAWAAEQLLLHGTQCREAWYLQVGGAKHREALGLGKKRDWPNRIPNTHATIARTVREIRQGYFPPRPADDTPCRGCAAAGACRFEEQRITRKEEARS